MDAFIPLIAGLGSTTCILSVLVLYNLVALVQRLRDKSDEQAGGLAKGAWGLSVVSLFLSLGCGWLTAIIALIMARIERGRAYRGESSMGSLPAVRIASLNSVFALILSAVLATALLIQYL